MRRARRLEVFQLMSRKPVARGVFPHEVAVLLGVSPALLLLVAGEGLDPDRLRLGAGRGQDRDPPALDVAEGQADEAEDVPDARPAAALEHAGKREPEGEEQVPAAQGGTVDVHLEPGPAGRP